MNNISRTKVNMLNKLKNYCLTLKEGAELMANINMEALIEGIEKSEQEISNGEGRPWQEAMAQIHKEVLGE